MSLRHLSLCVGALSAAALLVAGRPSEASPITPPGPAVADCDFAGPALHSTPGRITLHGKPFAYTAEAGLLPIHDSRGGEIQACIFFTAYLRQTPPGRSPRPIAFVWNGGPGANSTALHLEAFGPKRITSADSPTLPAPANPRLEDNPATLLGQTDLVFVDPVGTGFSRARKSDDEAQFYNTLGDAVSVAQFVQTYLRRFDRRRSPLFLVGESYGVWRAEAVAESLETSGQRVRGIALISGGLHMGHPDNGDTVAALSTPNRTATALYYRKLAPDLQADPEAAIKSAADWVLNIYLPGLAHRDALSDGQRTAIVDQLASFIGIPAARIDARTLIVTRHEFLATLVGPQHILGSLDMRLSGEPPADSKRVALIGDYLRRTLGYDGTLTYQGTETPNGRPSASVNDRWVYNQGTRVTAASDPSVATLDGPPGGVPPWLPNALRLNPSMKVFVATGLYDSYSSCLGMKVIANRVERPLRSNFTLGCYLSGHMIYRDSGPRMQLSRDLSVFLQRTLAGEAN